MRDELQRDRVLEDLIAFIAAWDGTDWIDDEKLHFLGKDLAAIWPNDWKDQAIERVQAAAAGPAAEIFIAGFREGFAASEERVKSPPSRAEIDKLLSRLRQAIAYPHSIDEAVGEVERFDTFVAAGGNPEVVVEHVVAIGEALLLVGGPRRRRASEAARLVAQRALDWASDNEQVWTIWVRALGHLGAFAAAELVAWEAIRRFPWNARLRHLLTLVVRRQRGRFTDSLRIAHEAHRVFPRSEAIAVQLALLLGQTGVQTDFEKAVALLVSSLDKRKPDSKLMMRDGSVLAAVLARGAKDGFLTRRQTEMIVARLQHHPRLLGAIGNRLIGDHRVFDVAEHLWRTYIKYAPLDVRARSQLARALIASGREQGVAEAIKTLRDALVQFSNEIVIRNHLAKALASTGTHTDRQEALALLRETISIAPRDEHARMQLSELLASSGDPKDRAASEQLLREVLAINPANKYAHSYLAQLQAAPAGVPVRLQSPETRPHDRDDEGFAGRDAAIDPARVVPPRIAQSGTLRRLRFVMENGPDEARARALQEMRELLERTPLAYARLLAIRHGIWRAEPDTTPPFAFAFERALRDRDEGALARLAEQYPRYKALTVVAQAIFGNSSAAAQIRVVMDPQAGRLPPIALVLKRRMTGHLALIKGGLPPETVVREKRTEILAALYDANEAGLNDPALAA